MIIHGKVTAQRKKIANFAITQNHHTFKNTIIWKEHCCF